MPLINYQREEVDEQIPTETGFSKVPSPGELNRFAVFVFFRVSLDRRLHLSTRRSRSLRGEREGDPAKSKTGARPGSGVRVGCRCLELVVRRMSPAGKPISPSRQDRQVDSAPAGVARGSLQH